MGCWSGDLSRSSRCSPWQRLAVYQFVAAIVISFLTTGSVARSQLLTDGNATPPAPAPAPPGEPGDESAQFVVETVASGLDNPCSIAIRAGNVPTAPFDIVVAESGAGRVVRYASDKPGEATPVVTGFPVDSFGGAPAFRTGPLGLAFIT